MKRVRFDRIDEGPLAQARQDIKHCAEQQPAHDRTDERKARVDDRRGAQACPCLDPEHGLVHGLGGIPHRRHDDTGYGSHDRGGRDQAEFADADECADVAWREIARHAGDLPVEFLAGHGSGW